MIKLFHILVLTVLLPCMAVGQTRKELEDQRNKALKDIEYVDNLIKQTERQKVTGLNELRVLGNKVELHEKVVGSLRGEASLIEQRIELNNLAVKLMERDLETIKKEYESAVINAHKTSKGHPYLVYILAARDFNQGYKRFKYIQEISRMRRKDSELISELKSQIEKTKLRLAEDLAAVNNLRQNEERQRNILRNEQNRKRKMVSSLTGREKQLRQELENRRRVARRIETEINRIIEEERKRSATAGLTPEMKIISSNFAGNKGRLPWPVEKGVITGAFGLQQHKDLAFVKENNPGIEITSNGKVKVRSVFNGEVASVFTISGSNMAVIVRHGNYYTVYQNLINVEVTAGQKIEIKHTIGEVYCDVDKGNKSILKFMIFRDREKLNPEEWLAKN